MRHLVLGLVMALLLVGVTWGAGPTPGSAYISDFGNNRVLLVNSQTGAPPASIGVGSSPAGLAIRPGGAKIYVTQTVWNGSVSVINTATNTAVKSIPVGRFPMGVAVSPDGHWVFVVNFLSPTLSVIDANADSVVAAPSVNVGMLAQGVAVNPNSALPYVYVTNWGSGGVTIVRTTDLSTLVVDAPVGTNPNGVAVAPNGSAVYVALEGDGKLAILDPQTAVVMGSVQVGSGPTGVAVAPDGRHVYVTNKKSDSLSVVDTKTLGVMTVQVGSEPTGVAVSSDGSHVYVTNSLGASLSILNALTNPPSPVSTIPLAGSFPVGIALVPGAPVITVTIEVPQAINLRSRGTLPVAILSTDTFDATRVDPETVTLAHAPVKTRPNGTLMWSFEDVNGTGRLALVVHIDRERLQLSPSDTEVVLEGQTYPDANNVVNPIRGTATVKVVP